jgi:hypothetical protein
MVKNIFDHDHDQDFKIFMVEDRRYLGNVYSKLQLHNTHVLENRPNGEIRHRQGGNLS